MPGRTAGDKEYTTASNDATKIADTAAKNNPEAAKLLSRARAVAGHFRRSGQATGKLDEAQKEDIGKVPRVYPFDRRALHFYPPCKRQKAD